jgi:phosphomannomutase
MNVVTVARVSAALARQLMEHVQDAAQKGVVIARDGRRMSAEFAAVAAEILMGHGLNVHVIEGATPTPVAAFAGRDLGAAATVVVTASHNPPAYNGYKVYSERHCQIVSPQDAQIRDGRRTLGPASQLPRLDVEKGRAEGLLHLVGAATIQAYFEALDAQCMGPLPPPAPLRIVTTALHGVGHSFVEAALKRRGFTDLHPVLEQAEPDATFPTVSFPNPEEDGALDLAIDLGGRVGADILIANDPDTDRLALGMFRPEGVRLFTGNEVGLLLADWLLASARSQGSLPAESAVLSTIVSTRMLDHVAAHYGAQCHRTLTGFKWIWDRALSLADEGISFRFGFEEALGYCVGDAVRDKDGIGAALVAAELASDLKAQGKTLQDRLEELWTRHGFYTSSQVAMTFTGLEGRKTIDTIMSALRTSPPASVEGSLVVHVFDHEAAKAPLGPANVLRWDLEDGSRLLFRPSGTEPKLKAYLEIRAALGDGGLFAAKREASARLAELEIWVRNTLRILGGS